MTLLNIVIAVLIGYVIWKASMSTLRMLATPPPEINPDDVVETEQKYRCSVCGTEVTMTAVNVVELKPPRHCREDMDEVPVG